MRGVRGHYERQIEKESAAVQEEVNARIEELRKEAREQGLDISQSPQGFSIIPVGADGKQISLEGVPEVRRERLQQAAQALTEQLRELRRYAAQKQMAFAEQVKSMNRQVAENAVAGLMDEMEAAFSSHGELVDWLREMREDVLENIHRFQPAKASEGASDSPELRYAVNLIVDHSESRSPPVVLEPAPRSASLFGYIQYRQKGGILETDFTMIRAGALHRANGGILVLRADELAEVPGLWVSLKAALRDNEITVNSPEKSGGIPIAGLPKPLPIPLKVKVILVGAPQWYYTYFSVDPEFQTYFRVKADVDADMEASKANLGTYAGLISRMAKNYGGRTIPQAATGRLLGMAARWAGDRTRLSAQFERVEDALREAAHLASSKSITLKAVEAALASRRERNSRIEDRMHEQFRKGTIMIDVSGDVVGQVNALTVRDMGDHAFGTPSRVTARASIGRRGIINVERDISLAGPIQQKGAMVVQGFLAGHFARNMPLSFNASLTFEQSYGAIEGDSASLAELIAILSELAKLPVRQDLAITGSVNQLGESQAVGGVHHKIEGFFRVCCDRGRLSGSQGVAIPKANENNLVLRSEIADAIARKRFHIYSVETIDEAVELFLGRPAGTRGKTGDYPPDSVYGRVSLELERYDRILRAGSGNETTL